MSLALLPGWREREDTLTEEKENVRESAAVTRAMYLQRCNVAPSGGLWERGLKTSLFLRGEVPFLVRGFLAQGDESPSC